MSMIGEYRRITLDQLQDLQVALQSNPEAVSEFLDPEESIDDTSNSLLDIAKAWHGIDFLLYGNENDVPSLLNVVMGGTEIGEDVGYGPARFLLPEQVKEANENLSILDKADLRMQFDPVALEAADIYPGGWTVGEPDALFEWLWVRLSAIREFFREAAQNGDVMLMYLS